MSVTFESGFNTTLSQALKSTGSETTISLAAVPITITSGVIRVGSGSNIEWMTFTGVSSLTVTGVTRGLDRDATSTTDATSTNKKNFAVGTPVKLVAHSLDLNSKANLDSDNVHTGGKTSFSSTTEMQFENQNLTTTERDALTGVTNGGQIYNTTLGQTQWREGGAWVTNDSGGTVADASETVAGKVELSTNAEQGTSTSTGGTGARLVVPNDQLVKTSSGAGDENKPAILNSSGQFAAGFIGSTADATSTEIGQLSGTTNIAESDTFFGATDATGAEMETLTDGSDADALHIHPTGNTYSAVLATRAFDAASGAVNYAHGLSLTPTTVIITAMNVGGAQTPGSSEGMFDGTNNRCIFVLTTGTAQSSSFAIKLGDGGSTTNFQSGVITVTSTNVVITWTKGGSGTSAIMDIIMKVFA